MLFLSPNVFNYSIEFATNTERGIVVLPIKSAFKAQFTVG